MATMAEALASLNNREIRHIVPVSGGKDSAALAPLHDEALSTDRV